MTTKTTIELTETQRRLVEELGVLYEQGGMQPAAGRILALLVVSDQVELTFEEICETLNISKSAVSNTLNFLINTDRVEYITQPGERKRYFRIKMKSMKDGITKALTGINAINVVLKKVLEQRPHGTREFNENLEELTGFLDFLKEELPLLIEKWERRHS